MKKEKLIKQFKEKYNDTLEIITNIGDTIDRNEYIDVKCKNNHIWNVRVRKCIERDTKGCPHCRKRGKSHEEFVSELNNKFPNTYEVLTKYVNSDTKVTVKHTKCGTIYSVLPVNILSGSNCPNCSRKKPKRNTEWFKDRIKELEGENYTLLDEYINTKTHVSMLHNICGHKYLVAPTHFLGGKRCPKCSHGSKRKTTDEFKAEVISITNGEYECIGEYKTNKDNIKFYHTKCKKTWETTPVSFISKKVRCPHCRQSEGEKRITSYLMENGYKFKSQVKFKNCKDKRHLPFDFCVYFDNLKLLIEYDGEQHFLPIYGEEKLSVTQYHDKIKTEFCQGKKKLKLVRINYKQLKNIEKVLDNVLSDY